MSVEARVASIIAAAAATMRTGMAIAEAPSGRVIYRNDEALRIFGDAPQMISTKEYDRLAAFDVRGAVVPSDDRPISRALRGEEVLGELVEIEREGVRRTINIKASPIRDDAGNVIAAVSIYEDVTESRRAHDDARRMQRLTDRLSTAVVELDVAKVLVEAGCEALGAQTGVVWKLRGDALHMLWAEHDERLSQLHAAYATIPLSEDFPICESVRTCAPMTFDAFATMAHDYPAVADANVARLEARMIMPLIAGGKSVGAVSFTFSHARTFSADDHTLLRAMIGQASVALERARLFEVARESEERLRMALGAARAGTWTVDVRTMRSTRDPSFRSLMGHDDQSSTADFGDIHPDDREIAKAAFERALRDGVPYEPEVRVRRGDGRYAWVRPHGRLIYEHGEPVALAGVVVDIDEAKRASLEAEERARLADRRKDEFLAMLGHELRNPLAPIATALTLMDRSNEGAFKRERDVIRRQVDHLTRLIDDLLDVSRITRGKVSLDKRRIELGAVIAQAIETASPLFEQRLHKVSIDVPREGLLVYADATRLAQVFQNLLTNARNTAIRAARSSSPQSVTPSARS